jgi:hypothetical protein
VDVASYVGYTLEITSGPLAYHGGVVTSDQSQTSSHSLTISPALSAAIPFGSSFTLLNPGLSTLTGYDAAGNVSETIDPKGIVTQYSDDMLGNQTQTIADYTDGTPTNDSNQTTDYTYDGNGDVLTMTAVMPPAVATISTASESGDVVTITTSAAHGFEKSKGIRTYIDKQRSDKLAPYPPLNFVNGSVSAVSDTGTITVTTLGAQERKSGTGDRCAFDAMRGCGGIDALFRDRLRRGPKPRR